MAKVLARSCVCGLCNKRCKREKTALNEILRKGEQNETVGQIGLYQYFFDNTVEQNETVREITILQYSQDETVRQNAMESSQVSMKYNGAMGQNGISHYFL